jgi:hypothetical protein
MNPDNQTPDEWLALDDVRLDQENALGTGLFLHSAQTRKEIVPNLTYDRCVKRAFEANAKAFKWIPHVVATSNDVRDTPCNERCNRRCMKPGCICDTSRGVCT